MQKAILCFRDYKNKELFSGITQPSNTGTHQNLHGAIDFNGRNAQDQVDLLAPYDCVVKAIAPYDNTVFFESVTDVETPIGINKCWFMCTHMNDNDFKKLGIKVGKTFKQGEPCYTEGNKGVGSGFHIHMEAGVGRFGGGNQPYYKSNDTYYYNKKYYYTYYPNVKNGYEYPMYDMFWVKNVEIVMSSYEIENGKKFYDGLWKILGKENAQVPNTGTGNDKNLKETQDKINSLITENSTLSKKVKELNTKIDNVRKAIGG